MVQSNTGISVNGLEKSYKNLKVLNKITFNVQRGSIFALLGSNGAGKTTTVKILTTLLKPDGGSAQVSGFDVVRQPEHVRAEISLTGQNAAVDNVLTGRENLRMIGKLRHLPDANKNADALLERFNLLEAADRRVATYSGGMRRRLDLAMGLMGTPSVLFLDEPTTGLDPQSRITMWKIIKERSETDPKLRLAELERRKAEIEQEIIRVNKGQVKLLDETQIKERFWQAMTTAREILADFRAVEQNFRELDRGMRERIATWERGKGELLEAIFQEQDGISQSEQGKSFAAFWKFLMSSSYQDDFKDTLDKVLKLKPVQEMNLSRNCG